MGCPSGQREQTVNLPAHAYEGSNPSPTMISEGPDFFVGLRLSAIRNAVVRNSQFVIVRSSQLSAVCRCAGVAQLVER